MLAFVNNVLVNMEEGRYLYKNPLFNLNILHSGSTDLHCYWWRAEDHFSPHPQNHLLHLVFLRPAILTGGTWWLTVVVDTLDLVTAPVFVQLVYHTCVNYISYQGDHWKSKLILDILLRLKGVYSFNKYSFIPCLVSGNVLSPERYNSK